MAVQQTSMPQPRSARLEKPVEDDDFVIPQVIIDVHAVAEPWGQVLKNVAGYLKVGVRIVCVVDPETQTMQIYSENQPPRLVMLSRWPFET